MSSTNQTPKERVQKSIRRTLELLKRKQTDDLLCSRKNATGGRHRASAESLYSSTCGPPSQIHHGLYTLTECRQVLEVNQVILQILVEFQNNGWLEEPEFQMCGLARCKCMSDGRSPDTISTTDTSRGSRVT